MSSYKCISNFGSSAKNAPTNDPLTYCLLQTVDSGFMHGGIGETISGKHSQNCQAFMSSYCATNWDEACEFASHDQSRIYPNTQQRCGSGSEVINRNMTAGEVLIANTAARKYLTQMNGACSLQWQPFDPTVASSPFISMWVGENNRQGNGNCVPVYEVNPKEIDNDPVMQKILAKPIIAWNILVNIYNNAVRKGTIKDLQGTNLYKFFMTQPFQQYVQQLASLPSGYNQC